jgi:hypothetical protein
MTMRGAMTAGDYRQPSARRLLLRHCRRCWKDGTPGKIITRPDFQPWWFCCRGRAVMFVGKAVVDCLATEIAGGGAAPPKG